MTFTPIAPAVHIPPSKIAADTYVVHQVQPALGQPLFIYLNSMVILGSEPVIVDTGTPANRVRWLEDVFSLVEPEDVRWVFLLHDDVDHSGNLDQGMTACPNAISRVLGDGGTPFELLQLSPRAVPLGHARRIVQRRGPNPSRRATADLRFADDARGARPEVGVYWAADTFATPLPDPEMAVPDLDRDFWSQGMAMFAFGAVSPWLVLLDNENFGKYVDGVQGLDIVTVAACHSPVIEGEFIQRGIDNVLGNYRHLDPPPMPDQSILDQIIAATSQPL